MRRCGPLGRCIRPNICLCEGGTVASSCTSSQTKGGRPKLFLDSISIRPANFRNNISEAILLSLVVATPTYETGNALDRGESGRCRVHCINGNCVDGKCQCRSGYQGEFCNERELSILSNIPSILSNNSSSQFQHNPICLK